MIRRSFPVVLVMLMVVTVLIVAAVHFSLRGADSSPTPTAPPPPAGSQIMANGVVEGARPEAALRPEVPGTVAVVSVVENQQVSKGAVLLELRNEVQQQQVALAEAEVAVARAGLDRVRRGEREERRKAAAAEVRALAAGYEAARVTWKRAQKHFESSLGGQEDRDRYQFLMQQAQAASEQGQAMLALAEAPPLPEELRAAEGKLAAAEACLALARAELARTRLLAPLVGRVLRVYAEPGEAAGPASPQPALLFADLSRRRVRAFVEELDAPRVQAGQRVVVTADALAGQEFRGVIAEAMPRMGRRAVRTDAPDEYKDVFFREVLIDLDGPCELIPNLRVKVRITAGITGP